MPTPISYSVVRFLARFLLGLFYHRIDVVGAERVPLTGPLIVAANHHNSLVDAMLLLAVIPRRLRTLANAPLFRHPLIGPFLRLLGALPVHRRQEAGDDPARNAALFAAAIPYALTAVVVRLLHRTAEEEATDKIAAGLILYPLAWGAEAWCVLRLGGGSALGAFLAALLPTGFFALAWQERLDRVGREARAFVNFLEDRDLPRRLRERAS